MGVDKRLIEYWRRQQAARKGGAGPPAGPRPELRRLDEPSDEPSDEPQPAERGSNVVPLELEDR